MRALFSNHQQLLEKIQHQQHSVVFSSLQEFYQPVEGRGFSIKYVWSGTEYYTLNGTQYAVREGQYLLSNDQLEGHVEIAAGRNVKGICINLAPQLIREAIAGMQDPGNSSPDPSAADYFCTAAFIENCYSSTESALSKRLREIGLDAEKQDISGETLSHEFFYSLATQLLADQLPLYRQYQNLPYRKHQIKKEVWRKLHGVKEYMDRQFMENPSASLLSTMACMSEFHFYRLFKKAFGISPHQYIIRKKLEQAKLLLQDPVCSISSIALETGFADVFSFSKSFRRHFGYPPSAFLSGK